MARTTGSSISGNGYITLHGWRVSSITEKWSNKLRLVGFANAVSIAILRQRV